VTLNQLRVFRTVAMTRNIATAAKSLFMTQPSISMQLRALEKDLRVTLYERRQGQIILTEAGNTLLQYAEVILRAEEEATKEIANLRGALLGRLRVGTNVTGGMYVAPTIIRRYRKEFPEVEVSLAIDTSPRIMDSILQGVIDVGLIGGPVDKARFEVEAVGEDELVLIASPENRLTQEKALRLDRLATESLIFPGIGSRSRWLLESRLREQGFPIRVALTMNGTEEVKKAVEASLGVGFVSRYAIERELRDGVLVQLEITGFRLKRDFELFWAKGRPLPGLGEPLLRFAKDYFSRRPDQEERA
jgi:LysR family transcriptional regulator, transcriptional activator of the cysJI operon